MVAEIEVVKGWCSPPGEASELCRELEDLAYEMADEFGCRYLQAVGPYEGTLADAAPAFAALCDRAAAHGLLVGVEFLPFTNIRTAAEAKELLDATDRPNAGCCVDIWHHTRGANDTDQIRALTGERVMCVQMNDGTLEPAIDDYYRDCLPVPGAAGRGRVRLRGLRAAARRAWVSPRRSPSRSARPSCGRDRPTRRHRRAADGMRSVLAEAGIGG